MKVTLTVEGMTCGHCEKAVENALIKLAGVSHVGISLKEKAVSVDYDQGQVSVEQISEAIEDQGYDVIS